MWPNLTANFICYYTLNSLTLLWLAESVQWIFEISALDVITADHTIIMSRILKVTGYLVMYDRRAWFLRVIMSTSHNSCCLPSVKKQKHDFQVFASNYNKTIITFGFCDISRTMKVLVRVISLSLRLLLITRTSTLIILDITKTECNNCLLHVKLKNVESVCPICRASGSS